ncbi:putative Choline dehydrogenase [Glarea lozoyensis 74030]|uniref:Putative Choline dehydrogenase n=1 Tax=Glarea lozoyensis (strain ATCC 74030 / MF5533) TaxID=1104152 RepID=H0EKP9_GLAL7|nr:putative Choline dehydrogenase [Glarea lozoyensis 74030]
MGSIREEYDFVIPSLNWGYKTAPQTHLKGQEVDYSRGKGLGGSSAINFSCWILGSSDDYDAWADMTGDDAWKWDGKDGVKERIKKITTYHTEVREEHRKFIDPKPEDHGTSGPLHLSYADPWEKGLENVFIAAEEVGMPLNKDVIVDESKTAKGILTINGRQIYANKEVILSAGALNTPQLLLLSGIGPRSELEKHNIPVIHEMSQIGQNLQDHSFVGSTLILKEGTNDRMIHEGDVEGVKKLREQHAIDKSGVLNTYLVGQTAVEKMMKEYGLEESV